MTTPLTIIATLHALPGKEADLERRMLEMVEDTRKEEGCIDYDLHRSHEDPAVYVMIENWVDAAALDRHFATPHMQRLVAELPDLVGDRLTIQKLARVGPPAA
jgi:quinol monooxygenase YgiN